METSAGTLIILDEKYVLLCHPTNGPWKNSFSPPKGHVEKNEDLVSCALRETKEEVGISLDPKSLGKLHIVDYLNKKNQITKKVYLFEVHIKNLSDLNLNQNQLPKDMLQLEEIDWASFLAKKEAKTKIFYRFKHLLSLLKD